MSFQFVESLEDRALFAAVAPVVVGNFATAGLDPQMITPLGSKVIFTAQTYQTGRELWVSDGTAAGTMMLRDIGVGNSPGEIGDIHTVGSLAYFTAVDNDGGLGYWRTDGTQSGTLLLNYIQRYSGETVHTSLGSTEYFNDGYSLFKTDGTEAGTVQVKNFASLTGYGQQSVITNLLTAGNYVYATLYGKSDPTDFYSHLSPIWRTNGSATEKLGSVGLRRIFTLGSDLYFMGTLNNITGAWKINTDKTFKNLSSENPNSFSTADGDFAINGNAAYYEVSQFDGELSLKQITGNSVIDVMPLGVTNSQSFMYALNGKVIILDYYDKLIQSIDVASKTSTTVFTGPEEGSLAGGGSDGSYVTFFVRNAENNFDSRYRTDGTLAGTKLYPKTAIEKLTDSPIVKASSKLFYAGADSTFRKELFSANLDASSPAIAFDLKESNSNVQVEKTYVAGTNLYVKVREASDLDGSSTVLWKITATGVATALDRLTSNTAYSDFEINTNGSRLFIQYGSYYTRQTIRVYDGTQFVDSNINFSELTYIGSIGNKAIYDEFFYSDSGIVITDGTTAGTIEVSQYQDSALDSRLVTVLNGVAYFVINQSDTKVLWQSDGTEAGTHAVNNLLPFYNSDFYITGMSSLGGKLILLGSDYTGDEIPYSNRVFVFDPKTSTSTLISVGGASEQPRVLGVVGSNLIFRQGDQLCRTNGTAAGTSSIHTFTDYFISSDDAFVSGSYLYFTVQKEEFYNNYSYQIWRTDGTAANTVRVDGLDGATTAQAVALGGVNYFKDVVLAKLYSYDGTKVIQALNLPNVFDPPQNDDTESFYNLKVFNSKIYYSRRFTTQSDALYAFTPDTVTPPPPPPPSTLSISGKVYIDLNKNGKKDATEAGLSGVKVFIDANLNGKLDTGEKFAVTSSTGYYTFSDLTKATYNLRAIIPSPYKPWTSATAKLVFSGTPIIRSFGVI